VPELPEVETIRRRLATELDGRSVVDAGAHPSAKFRAATEIVGARLDAVGRRGKYLLVDLEDGRDLVVHLGMTGALGFVSTIDAAADDPYVRAWWALDDGRTLRFRDVRRFGRIAVVQRGAYAALPTLAALGPEPFDDDLTAASFHAALQASRARLKTAVLGQRIIAGVGNIYADEAFWRAGVNPAARRIGRAAAGRLLDALRAVLRAGIDNGGTTLRDYRDADGGTGTNQFHLDCYGRGGLPCRRCATVLRRRVVDGRTTVSCPTCQR
jgi:formamidopyrimidine-DNA glycosylase